MLKVAGCWELGWNTPIKEIDLWEYPLREFGVDELIMSPVTGIRAKVTETESIEKTINLNNNLTVVFCHEDAEHDLIDFEHPKDALYVFGKANYSPFNNLHKTYDSTSVKIQTNVNKGMLWPHQAASIILYDRFIKNGNHSHR